MPKFAFRSYKYARYCFLQCSRLEYLSEPSIQTFGFTPMYFPFPHPISAPKLPCSKEFKKSSTTGHGYVKLTMSSLIACRSNKLSEMEAVIRIAYLISSVTKMGSNRLVDTVYMLLFVFLLVLGRSCYRNWLWF